MAGTRRRSRISDMAAAVFGQRSTVVRASTDAPSADDEHRRGGDVNVDNHDDEEPSRPLSPASRSTTGRCRRCKNDVGEFYNSWHKITGSYYLPALLGSYSSRLQPNGRQKEAAVGTDIEGCIIRPLVCPNCTETLGITAVDAPDSKHAFRGRDFFKLPRIELRCEVSPSKFVVVEPLVDAAPDPLAVVEHNSDSEPSPPAPEARIGDMMEVDSRPPHAAQPPPPPLSGHQQHHHPQAHHQQHHDHHHHYHHHQPLQQVEANRQPPPPPPPPLQSPRTQHGPPQKSPSNPLPSPATKPIQDAPKFMSQPPTPKEASIGLANRTRDLPPGMSHVPSHSHSQSPALEPQRTNGHHYPRSPQEVQLDAIERLQTQISQNSGALSVHGRGLQQVEETVKRQEDGLRREFQGQLHHQNVELRRVDDAVVRLQHEMRGIHELLENLTREVQATREAQAGRPIAPGMAAPSAQDTALELMANQVSIVSQKANEVDTLKITIEIMKSKIQRLEEAALAPPPSQAPAHPFPSPREPPVHSAHSSHAVPSYHATPTSVPHISTPVHPTQRQTAFHSHGTQPPVTPEVSQRPEPPQSQSGWVTVNASTKRSLPNGLDGPHDSLGQPLGSPKRPKLAPIEPRVGLHTHSHTLPQSQSQTNSRESVPQSTLASQPAGFVPYGTQDGPSDDSWRPESQRLDFEHRSPRGRGRGGGPGSRGRPRKSLPSHMDLGTPEWEKEEWQGVTDSQTSPDGYYNHIARSGRGGILRRGSGGGAHASRMSRPPSSSGRAVSLGMQGVTAGPVIGMPQDPYAHTKKTRTKPTRNADGVLIRKDGRPDMRSQSSAANLRKVHARKEEQKSSERSFTPTSLHHSMDVGTETPSPTAFTADGQDLTTSVQKKHNMIMGKMFPGGVDVSRKEHDYARQVFEESQGHTAQPRGQHHLHHHHQAAHSPHEIKQTHHNGDVDMDRTEDHADDEGQSPSGQSDNSGRESQYHDAHTHEEERTQAESKEKVVADTPPQNEQPAVDSSATMSSATVGAVPTQA
ncbi:hypothetical protein BCR34DRAFT_627159 [Clohesyomyces aquaticus]|uniref:Uncharacterized protein n=1 Tax=Clohesyomyces aquaticus TaxID=1231657 RepID=A0A1Y1Z1F1_9PLEO|nr:hypothetical protein BCR34DRAFT_627159 [Clohesyomyces aquaticus]